MWGLVLAALLAHPEGFHKRITLELWAASIDGLVAMDLDGGDRCELLRAGADRDHDGVLDERETAALKKKLVTMATRALKLSISGYPVAVEIADTKLSLKNDSRVGKSGVSVAVLLKMRHPYAVKPGMTLTLEDEAPDHSEVQIEVYQHPAADAGGEAPVKRALGSGETLKVRLGALAPQ